MKTITQEMTDSARVVSIVLDRMESTRAFWRATSFSGANSVLREWAESAPAKGGYDKVCVRIKWQNKVEHELRVDLKHPSQWNGAEPDVAAELRYLVSFVEGSVEMAFTDPPRYLGIMARYTANGYKNAIIQLRESCMLDDF